MSTGILDNINAPSGAELETVPLRHWGRIFGAAAVLGLLAFFAYIVSSSQSIQWSAIAEYLFNPAILKGVLVTIELTVLAMVIGTVIGVVLAVMRMSANPVLSSVAAGYVWFFRGTPLMVQIFFWFNIALFIPVVQIGEYSISTNMLISAYSAGLLALALHEAANMAEIVRGGILSVDNGQMEASLALGLMRRQAMRRIVLPQAVKVILPPTGNQAIGMLKATAMVSVIGTHDLLTQAQNTYARNFLVIELLIVASIWYLALTTVASIGQYYLERHFQRDTVRQQPQTLIGRIGRSVNPFAGAAS
ncbi:amino acid ABC transporter permease [Ensifer sp. YR511]|uniref:amino acid ABC transporter permease n=1 Tax=Ensifer sp. YR511 TaxID=1855294 RepID=UPI00087E703D|nr:amino acid ABC transporter permease [Ensifer sp. YR511]SDN76175.1 polar amino acid transport system permease protein [Ensifer sp. YR511]